MNSQPLRRTGQTLWSQIADTLSEDMALGGLAPGERLPSEQELAGRFGVNRHTVRRAIQDLEAKGLVRSEQGRGTFVEDVVSISLGRRIRFSQSVGAETAPRSQRLLRSYREPARRAAAEALDLRPGTPLLCLETLGRVSGRPVVLGYHCFDASRFAGLDDAFRETASVTACLARYGIDDYTRARTSITAEIPGAEQARLLKQPRNRPVLRTEWRNVTADGRPVEYGITLMSGDRAQLVVEV